MPKFVPPLTRDRLFPASVFDSTGRIVAYCMEVGDAEQIVAAFEENQRLREACEAVLAWYDRDGSVGGACDPMKAMRAALSGKGE